MLTVVTHGKASPGGTVLTSALMLTWRTPVLAVDADPSGGDMAPGLLAGRGKIDRGLLSWSTAVRRDTPAQVAASMFAQHAISFPEAPHAWLLAGVLNAATTGGLDEAEWERLAAALALVWSQTGRDVLVDTGRLAAESCWPVIRAADRVLLVVRPSGRSVLAAVVTAQRMCERLGELSNLAAVVVGTGEYQPREIAGALQMPIAGQIPFDSAAAAVLSDGAMPGLRGLGRSRLMRAAGSLADQFREQSMGALGRQLGRQFGRQR